ncbi:MAG: hypothetical protein R3Y59_01525 [bacterium]
MKQGLDLQNSTKTDECPFCGRKLTDERLSKLCAFFSNTEAMQNVVAYTIDGTKMGDSWSKIFVIYNGQNSECNVSLPQGTWRASCYDAKINLEKGLGSFTNTITVPQTSAVVLYQL